MHPGPEDVRERASLASPDPETGEGNPAAFLRVLGGTLERMEQIYDFKTGKSRTLWYIFVAWGNVKVKPMKGEEVEG